MWKKLGIASRLNISLVIVVMLGFSTLIVEQWMTLNSGLQTLEHRSRQAIGTLLAQNIAGAVRWKKGDVIEKAYGSFVGAPDSNVANIYVADAGKQPIIEYKHKQFAMNGLANHLPEIFKRHEVNDSVTLDLDGHSIVSQKVFNAKDGSLAGFLVMAFSNASLSAFIVSRALVSAVLSLIALLVIVTANYFAIRMMFTRPMAHLNEIANDLANGEGDLTRRLNLKPRGELGELAGHINCFLEKLQSAVGSVVSSAAEVRESLGSARNAAEANRSLLDRQTGEISQAAGSIQSISERLGRMTESARGLADTTAQARTEAEAADKIADEAVCAVTSLTSQMEASESVITSLRDQSDSIGSVLGVIEAIAEQTNLLALNAAIEAARAGEQGRGFAVVADEVRTLASRTQQSTLEIKGIIDALQGGAQNAALTIEHSQADVSRSAEQINLVKLSLAEIVNHMEQITDTNHQVTEGIGDQSNVANGISSNLDELNHLSSSILENGSATARYCEQSAKINDQLNQKIGFFKV